MKKFNIVGSLTILLTAVGIILLIWWLPAHQQDIINITRQYPLLAPLIVILWRILAIILPPLPGSVISFALIPVLGWFWSYIYALIGVMIGTTIAFYLARNFREQIVGRFVPLRQLHEWESRVSNKTHFLAFLGIRLTTGPIFDFMSYVAGLSKVSYKKFFLVTLIAEIPVSVVYYLGGVAYSKLSYNGGYLGIAALVILVLLLYGFNYLEAKIKRIRK
jgi:uncharacterized membrane protein YdjX (TVP38/TMEM64 family)